MDTALRGQELQLGAAHEGGHDVSLGALWRAVHSHHLGKWTVTMKAKRWGPISYRGAWGLAVTGATLLGLQCEQRHSFVLVFKHFVRVFIH